MAVEAPRATFQERFLAQQERARGLPRPGRPRYVGCTESAEVREAFCKALLRTWPGGPVDEMWSVVGGMSGLDALAALSGTQTPVKRLVFFDRDPLQLRFGELVLALVSACATRDSFVEALFGRSMKNWGRLVSASTMLDFLDEPIDESVAPRLAAQLPSHLKDLYLEVFACLARREGWPLVWPSFGRSTRLSLRGLPNAKRRLGGGRNEALHVNEAGWLFDERRYALARGAIEAAEAVDFRAVELADLGALVPARRVVFISNIDGSPQFMQDDALASLRARLAGAAGAARDDGRPAEEACPGTLLLSTLRAEWLPWTEST